MLLMLREKQPLSGWIQNLLHDIETVSCTVNEDKNLADQADQFKLDTLLLLF